MNTETETAMKGIALKLRTMYKEAVKLYEEIETIRNQGLIKDPWSDETETIEELTDNVMDTTEAIAEAAVEIETAISKLKYK